MNVALREGKLRLEAQRAETQSQIKTGGDRRVSMAPPITQREPAAGNETRGSNGQRRGPNRDLQSSKVAKVVHHVAPDGNWKSKLDEVCEALDLAEITPSMNWYKKDKTCILWVDYPDKHKCVEAIAYRLKKARQAQSS
jgi:hypothetical protein